MPWAGRPLSDLFGARRVFSTGWALLIVGSVVAGMADTVSVELVGRAIQGGGAALIVPSALTLLMMPFGSDPRELTKALALYGGWDAGQTWLVLAVAAVLLVVFVTIQNARREPQSLATAPSPAEPPSCR